LRADSPAPPARSFVAADLATPSGPEELIKAVGGILGHDAPLHVLVNNAGAMAPGVWQCWVQRGVVVAAYAG